MLGDLKYRSQAPLLTALVEGDIGIIIKPTHDIRIIIIIYIYIYCIQGVGLALITKSDIYFS